MKPYALDVEFRSEAAEVLYFETAEQRDEAREIFVKSPFVRHVRGFWAGGSIPMLLHDGKLAAGEYAKPPE